MIPQKKTHTHTQHTMIKKSQKRRSFKMKKKIIQQRMKMKMNNNNKPTIHTIEHTPTHSKTHSRFARFEIISVLLYFF